MRRIIEKVELIEQGNTLLIRRTFWSRVVDVFVLLLSLCFIGILLSLFLFYFIGSVKENGTVANLVSVIMFIVFAIIEIELGRKTFAILFRYSQFLVLDRANMEFRQGQKLLGSLTGITTIKIKKYEDDGAISFKVSLAAKDTDKKLDVSDGEMTFSSYDNAMRLGFALSSFLKICF